MVCVGLQPSTTIFSLFEAFGFELDMLKMVPEAGLEPARDSPYAPQAYVSAISPPGLHQKGKNPTSEEGVL